MARKVQEINAASMADIAFLLLIFFLVTTTLETNKGISRLLPPIEPPQEQPDIIRDKNIFIVLINKDDRLLVEDSPMELKDLRQAAVAFLDNNGDGTCSYCQGVRASNSSDNPEIAIISLQNDRLTTYQMYIAVQDELVAAYNELRSREARRLYNEDYMEMERNAIDGSWAGDRSQLEERLGVIRGMYPQKLSEAEPKRNQ